MQTYPAEINPEQVVRWLMAETRIAPNSLRIGTWRTMETRDIPVRREFHLGDEEREDRSEVATIATVEIAPAHAHEGWTLRVTVENEAGPRTSEMEPAIGGEQKMRTAWPVACRGPQWTRVAYQRADSSGRDQVRAFIGEVGRGRRPACLHELAGTASAPSPASSANVRSSPTAIVW